MEDAPKKLTRREKQGTAKETPGKRKRLRANQRKAEQRERINAALRNHRGSPRKARLVADLIRGQEVGHAMNILKLNAKRPAQDMFKLLRSALDNWGKIYGEDDSLDDLYVSKITVDSARALKRIRPAPQGRAHRIRKRSYHIFIEVERFDYEGIPLDFGAQVEAMVEDED